MTPRDESHGGGTSCARANSLGISAAVWAQLQWVSLGDENAHDVDLIALGFCKDAERDAKFGAVLMPIWWYDPKKGRTCIVNHRIRYDQNRRRPGKYDFPKGQFQTTHGAYGRLLVDEASWLDPTLPILFTEGEKKAAVLASYLQDTCIVSCPGVWMQSERQTDQERSSKYPKRPNEDFQAIDLRGRKAFWFGDSDARTNRYVRAGTDDSCERLCQRGAVVYECYPPDGFKGWDDYIIEVAKKLPPEECEEKIRQLLMSAMQGAKQWQRMDGEDVDPSPAHGQLRLIKDVLKGIYTGPSLAREPANYFIANAPGAPLAYVSKDQEHTEISAHPIWVDGRAYEDTNCHIFLSSIVDGRVKNISVAQKDMADPRKFGSCLLSYGVDINPNMIRHVLDYIHEFLKTNSDCIPKFRLRSMTGWNEDFTSFMYGSECIGGDEKLADMGDSQACGKISKSLLTSGYREAWKSSAEAMIASSPTAALVLAASLSSPLIKLFKWPVVGVLLGDIGGSGKSTILRLAASAFGFHGEPNEKRPTGIVGSGDGTIRGLLLQFSKLAHLPHLADEINPGSNPQKQKEFENLLYQLYEGQEHVRANRMSTGSRSGMSFVGSVVLAGEMAACDFMTKQGAFRRYLTPRAPYFQEGFDFTLATKTLAMNYGHLGKCMVTKLVDADHNVRSEIERAYEQSLIELGAESFSGELERSWGQQIGTCLATVKTCEALCWDSCPDPTLWKSQIIACWNSLKPQEKDLVEKAYFEVKDWIASNRHRILPSNEKTEQIERVYFQHDRAKPRDPVVLAPIGKVVGDVAKYEGSSDEVLPLIDVFPKALQSCLQEHGHSPSVMISQFGKRGYILKPKNADSNTSSAYQWQTVKKINGASNRVYTMVYASKEEATHPQDSPSSYDAQHQSEVRSDVPF